MEQLSTLTRQIETNRALTKAIDKIIDVAMGGPAIVRKAAVTAVGASDVPAFTGDPDAQPLQQAVARRSVAGRLLEFGAIPVPMRQLLPAPDDDSLTPVWVGEGASPALARLTSGSTYCDATFFQIHMALQRELVVAGSPSARSYVLARALRALTPGDNTIIDAVAASTSRPPGLTWNRSAIGSGSPADLGDDIAAAVGYVSDGAPIAPVWVASPRGSVFCNATGLQVFRNCGLRGGEIAGAPLVIAAEAADRLILIDAAQIAIADGPLEIAQSRHAAIEMSDAPSQNSATGTGSTMVSAWQANATVLKFTRWLSWAALRDDAVAFIELSEITGSPV